MLVQLVKLLPYPYETQRRTAAEQAGTPFLFEAPDLSIVAEWLQFSGDDAGPEDFRWRFAPLAPHGINPPVADNSPHHRARPVATWATRRQRTPAAARVGPVG